MNESNWIYKGVISIVRTGSFITSPYPMSSFSKNLIIPEAAMVSKR